MASKRMKLTDAGDRRKDVLICCPIAFGSISFWMGKKADEQATHQWTLYVRGPHGENLSYFLEKVVFVLHHSFSNPERELRAPPYEVTEKGWGEFEAKIRLHFRDATEKMVEISHTIALYPPNNGQLSAKKPVLSERYDEVVFTEPTEDFYEHVLAHQHDRAAKHPLEEHFPIYSDLGDVERITAAREVIKQETQALKAQITRLDGETDAYRQQVALTARASKKKATSASSNTGDNDGARESSSASNSNSSSSKGVKRSASDAGLKQGRAAPPSSRGSPSSRG